MDAELIIVMLLGLGVIAGLGAALYLQRRKSPDDEAAAPPAPGPRKRNKTPIAAPGKKGEEALATQGAEELMREGKYEEAARLAMRNKSWEEAKAYYLEAGQLGNAAHCAHRAGNLEEAADLYEQAGDLENAAKIWEKVGDHEHARQLRRTLLESRQVAKANGEPANEDTGRIATKKKKKEVLDAIERGDYRAAAEIAESAGMNEEAAQAWVKVARRTRNPADLLDRIERLSPAVAHNFLELETKAHPPSPRSATLHYRLALSYARLGEPAGAREILDRLLRAVGDHAEATALAEQLRNAPHRFVALLCDEQVASAKQGPSIEELEKMAGDAPCDLTNIEVFYRLGLAHLAHERLQDAERAFAIVDSTSPGYRDARERLKLLRSLSAQASR